MSGAFGVRGGFDSHAFPPALAALAVALFALGPVRAGADPRPVGATREALSGARTPTVNTAASNSLRLFPM